MKINIENAQEHQIEIFVDRNISVEELNIWRMLIPNFLRLAFEGKRVGLITIDPQSYSLGYEFEGNEIISIEGKSILTNLIADVSPEVIDQIARSEEFNRGLLRIFQTNASSSKLILKEHILAAIKGKGSSKEPKPLLFCDDDGRILYWNEVRPPLQQIQEIIAEPQKLLSTK